MYILIFARQPLLHGLILGRQARRNEISRHSIENEVEYYKRMGQEYTQSSESRMGDPDGERARRRGGDRERERDLDLERDRERDGERGDRDLE